VMPLYPYPLRSPATLRGKLCAHRESG